MSRPTGDDDWIDAYEESLDQQESGNKPRTKHRPRHDDAEKALVIGVDRGRYRLQLESGTAVTANRAKELRREAVVVGDSVDVVGDLSGEEGTLGRVVRIHPRRNVLRRSADDTDQFERVIVANADQLLMVVATKDPEPRSRLIDRYLVAALDAGITPILCITKTDLSPAEPLLDYARGAGIEAFALRTDGQEDDLDKLRETLAHKTTVTVGHSGVGKSTLVNRLVPGASRDVGGVNVHTGRGRHTSSSSRALALGQGGWIIDTPGVRSFGLGHVTPEAIDQGFPDLQDYLAQCPRGCQHQEPDVDCALRQAAENAESTTAARIDSLIRLRALAGSS